VKKPMKKPEVFLLVACTLVIPVWTYGGTVGKAGSS
jgi:hypothetical protein